MSHSSSPSQALEDRIEALIRFAERLRLEKKELEEEKKELERKLEEQEQRVSELEKRTEALSLPGASDPNQRKEAKKRIDGMIREIDRCIALLEH